MQLKWTKVTILTLFLWINCNVQNVFAKELANPCLGTLLNLDDRPTNADSACVVPYKHIVVEAGYQYQNLSFPGGELQIAPLMMPRLGLPANTELFALLPNFIHQTVFPTSGFSASTIGVRHEFNYTQKWIFSGEALVTPPSGSDNYGSSGLGAAFNIIVNYSFSSKWSVLGMLGMSTITQSVLSGGERYQSINPDFVITYTPIDTVNLFGEIYGQTQTGPQQGNGFNSMVGISYLVNPAVVIDLEINPRLNGNDGGYNRYIGSGIVVKLA